MFKSDSATTKIRLVHDASAKSSKESVCLNDMLNAGPSLIPDMIAVLLKFRLHKIGLVADLKR